MTARAEKVKIKEAVVVEGRYDAHLLRSIVDGPVIETGGFSVLKNKKLIALIRGYAEKTGVIILTDSDNAGFLIRNRLKGAMPDGAVKHAYIPKLMGKEKRKKKSSAEGNLGVEGMDKSVVLAALVKAGVTFYGDLEEKKIGAKVTKADLYEDGFFGRQNSGERRKKLKAILGLPEQLSVNALAGAITEISGVEAYKNCVLKIKEEEKNIGREGD